MSGFVSADWEATAEAGTTQTLVNFALSAGSNRKVLIAVCSEDAGDTDGVVSGVTFNASATGITKIDEIVAAGAGLTLSVWEILEADLPATGSYNIVGTYTGTVDKRSIMAIELDDMDQNVYDAAAKEGLTDTQTVRDVELTTVVVNSLIVCFALGSQGSLTGEPNTSDYTATQRLEQTGASHSIWASTGDAASIATYTVGLTWSGACVADIIASAHAPYVAPGGSPSLVSRHHPRGVLRGVLRGIS